VYSLRSKSIKRLPIRGIQNYLPLFPGIAEVNGTLHFRGSRAGEVAYVLDDFNVTNPFFNSNGVPLIPEAIEEVQIHTGAYGPLLGTANGGVVVTRLRKGGESLTTSFDVQTDEFAKPGQEFLKTTVQGYRNIVATVGGPLPLLDMRFFLAGQHTFLRNRQPMFFEPMHYDSLVTDAYGARQQGVPLPGPLYLGKNYLDRNWSQRTILQGNTSLDFAPLHLQLFGSYSYEELPQESAWPYRLTNYFRQARSFMNEEESTFGGARGTILVSNDTEIRFSVSFLRQSARQYDPDFGDHWPLYTDSLANAQIGYTGFVNRYNGPYPFSTIFSFNVLHPHAPNNSYAKNEQSGRSASLEFSHQVAPFWRFHAEASYEQWTMRFYHVGNIRSYLQYLDPNRDGIPERTFIDDKDRRITLSRQGSISNYGFDYLGSEANDGPDAPRRPTFVSLALDNAIKHEALTLNVGGVLKIFSSDNVSVPNYENPIIDHNYNIVDDSEFKTQKPVRLFLPRLSTTYSLTPTLAVHAAFGENAQYSPLQHLYLSRIAISSRVNPATRSPYWLGSPLIGFFTQPERASVYEIGISHVHPERGNASFRFFSKSLKHQFEPGRVYNESGNALFVALHNKGSGEAKGIEFSGQLNPNRIVSLSLSYTLSIVRGTSSSPFGLRREMSDVVVAPVPVQLYPLDYDQTHRGLLMATLSYADDDGPLLDGLRITTLFTINSGHRYTRNDVIRNLGASNPWVIGVRTLTDPRAAAYVETQNRSSTPWVYNLDIQVSKSIGLGLVSFDVYVNILNALNTKHVLNVYPTTGTPDDDSWLASPFSDQFKALPIYEEFYHAINLQNRWAYMGATGYDLYGTPRQIRIGLRVMM
jgi:hypothetical protein